MNDRSKNGNARMLGGRVRGQQVVVYEIIADSFVRVPTADKGDFTAVRPHISVSVSSNGEILDIEVFTERPPV